MQTSRTQLYQTNDSSEQNREESLVVLSSRPFATGFETQGAAQNIKTLRDIS